MERMRAFQNIYKPIFLINSLQTATALTFVLTTMLTPYTPNSAQRHRNIFSFSIGKPVLL